jgi:CHAD domain-containing protein
VSATASAVGERRLAKKSDKIVRSLSAVRQIEVDRKLLSRVRELGWLPDEVAFGVDARWSARLREGEKEVSRVPEAELESLRRKLARFAKKNTADLLPRLEKARTRAEENLSRELSDPASDRSDRSLHRYRLAVKKARYLAEDLALMGSPGLETEIEGKKALQDAFGRWNDLRLFRRDLDKARREAERRGTVTFVSELDRLISALEPVVESARAQALRSAGAGSAPARVRRRAKRSSGARAS